MKHPFGGAPLNTAGDLGLGDARQLGSLTSWRECLVPEKGTHLCNLTAVSIHDEGVLHAVAGGASEIGTPVNADRRVLTLCQTACKAVRHRGNMPLYRLSQVLYFQLLPDGEPSRK